MKTSNTALRYLLPRLQDMLLIAIFIGALLVGPRMINGDLGRHLTLGKYMVTTLNIPTHDLFSNTKPGQPRPPYEWLAQVIFYVVYRILNLDGIVILSAVILAVSFLIVYKDALQRSSMPVLVIFLTSWAATASSIDWLTRPHLFSFLLFAIWVLCLEKLRKAEKISLWWFPALMLIWANIHGGFVFGILAWAAYFAGWLLDIWRKSSSWNVGRNLIVVGSTSLIASILTPDLWRNWQGVLANNSVYILSHTSETMPPDFAIPGTLPFAFLLLLVLALLLINWKRMPFSHIFLLVGFAIMSLIMARNIPFFSIAAVPILSENIGNILTNLSIWHKLEEHVALINVDLKGYVWPVLALLVAIASFIIYQTKTLSSFNQFNSQALPVQAVEWLEKHPQNGNMFNDFNWGGYLLFKLWPGTQVFIDSQSDFYGEDLTRQYAEILTGQGNWDVELSQHNVTWLLIPSHSGLAESARKSSDWQAAYEDQVAIIFVRK